VIAKFAAILKFAKDFAVMPSAVAPVMSCTVPTLPASPSAFMLH